MKSNRMRSYTRVKGAGRVVVDRWRYFASSDPVDLEAIAAPAAIEKPKPEKIVRDVVFATLHRVRESGNAEIAAAAAQYLERLRAVS